MSTQKPQKRKEGKREKRARLSQMMTARHATDRAARVGEFEQTVAAARHEPPTNDGSHDEEELFNKSPLAGLKSSKLGVKKSPATDERQRQILDELEHEAMQDVHTRGTFYGAISETPTHETEHANGTGLMAVERQRLRDGESLYIDLESSILSHVQTQAQTQAHAQGQASNAQITASTMGSATARLLLTKMPSELVAMIFHDYFSPSSAQHCHLMDGNQGTENVEVIHAVAEAPPLCVDHPVFWSNLPPALFLDFYATIECAIELSSEFEGFKNPKVSAIAELARLFLKSPLIRRIDRNPLALACMKHELVHPSPSEHVFINPVSIVKEYFIEEQGLNFVKMVAGIGRRVRGGPHESVTSMHRLVYTAVFNEAVAGTDITNIGVMIRAIGAGWGEQDFEKWVKFVPKSTAMPTRVRNGKFYFVA